MAEREPEYVFAFGGRGSKIIGVSIQKEFFGKCVTEVQKMFILNLVTDYAIIWSRNGGEVTGAEQSRIARRLREHTHVWVHRDSDIAVRGGIFGRRYVRSESCMIIQWDGLSLSPEHARWTDFAAQCRKVADAFIKKGRTGPDRMKREKIDFAQEQRNSDPGYRVHVKDHKKRSVPPMTLEPPDRKMVQLCADLVRRGKYNKMFGTLADKYGVPPPKTSSDMRGHPHAYAFYDSTSRTVVYMPEDLVGLDTCMMSILAGFFLYVSQYGDWRYDDDPVKSANTELDTVSDLATDAAALMHIR